MELELIEKLDKDTKKAAATLNDKEARFLVDLYYTMQDDRKRADNQVLSMATEPHTVLAWFAKQSNTLELRVKSLLDEYSNSKDIGVWARSIDGIGPVISAGLMAHINIRKCICREYEALAEAKQTVPEHDCKGLWTAGCIWRFAGLDPTVKWEKGQKRPWNADLKVLCWKIGESFVKVSNKPEAIYGQLYKQRKELETSRNEQLMFKDQAAAILEAKKIGKDTDAYKAYAVGKLPPAHIHARAKRYAVKIFLSHWHERAYTFAFGIKPPLPYPIAILGHSDYIPPPK